MADIRKALQNYIDENGSRACKPDYFGKFFIEETKKAVPIPESVVDKYVKTRDETNIENRNLGKLQNDIINELQKAYPDFQSLRESGQFGTLSHSQMEELGINKLEHERPRDVSQSDYDSFKRRTINDMKVLERLYIEAKRQQWRDDNIVKWQKVCRNMMKEQRSERVYGPGGYATSFKTSKEIAMLKERNRAGPLINLRSQNNHNLINVKNLKNAAISKRMENFEGLKMGGVRKTRKTRKQRNTKKNNKSRKHSRK